MLRARMTVGVHHSLLGSCFFIVFDSNGTLKDSMDQLKGGI